MILKRRNKENFDTYLAGITGGWAIFLPIFIVLIVAALVVGLLNLKLSVGLAWFEIVICGLAISAAMLLVEAGIMFFYTWVIYLLSKSKYLCSKGETKDWWRYYSNLAILLGDLYFGFALGALLNWNDVKGVIPNMEGPFDRIEHLGVYICLAIVLLCFVSSWVIDHIIAIIDWNNKSKLVAEGKGKIMWIDVNSDDYGMKNKEVKDWRLVKIKKPTVSI